MKNLFSRLPRPYPLPNPDAAESGELNRPLDGLFNCLFCCDGELNAYGSIHNFPGMGYGEVQQTALAQLAVVRLQSLLDQGRRELAGLFDSSDVSLLLSSYGGEFVPPSDAGDLADVVTGVLQARGSDAESSEHTALLQTLRSLTALQVTALLDALEVIHHSGDEPLEVLQRLNIQLQ